MATGDVKYRFTNEILTGWVILNGQTIGSAASGASQRANADTQNLFVYLWTNCASVSANNHCPVVGGLGATALADYQANKVITLPDMRDSDLVGRDCMGNSCLGGLLSSNILSGHGDGVDTAGAWGGLANQTIAFTIAQANLPNVSFVNSGMVVTPAQLTINNAAAAGCNNTIAGDCTNSGSTTFMVSTSGQTNFATSFNLTLTNQGHAASGGSGTPMSNTFAIMNPFKLGTFYIKL
jgi:hypothetical protein